MKIPLVILSQILLSLTLVSGKILFNGNATLGSKAVWKNEYKEGAGTTIRAVNDVALGAKVWEFMKPPGARRCEGRGAKGFQAAEGDDLYIGWSLKLAQEPSDLTTTANFHLQAYPFRFGNSVVLRTKSGQLTLEQYSSNNTRTELWNSDDTRLDQWYSIVLRVKMSRDIAKGFVEFWFQGDDVTFSNGKNRFACKTLNGLQVDPVWGVIGGDKGGVNNRIGNIIIATTLEEAMPSVQNTFYR